METSDHRAQLAQLRLARVDRPDGTTLAVAGEIDMNTGDRFHDTVMSILDEPGVERLLLDLAALRFIDSNGVTVLVKAHRIAEERGLIFGVSHTAETIRGLFEMLGVYDLLTVTDPAS